MMFSGILLKGKAPVRILAIAGMLALVVVNVLEMQGTQLFSIPVAGLMKYGRPELLFIGLPTDEKVTFVTWSPDKQPKVVVGIQ